MEEAEHFEDLEDMTRRSDLVFLRRRSDTGAFRLVSSQGLIADRSGNARTVAGEVSVDAPPTDMPGRFGEGLRFDDVVERVRAARAGLRVEAL